MNELDDFLKASSKKNDSGLYGERGQLPESWSEEKALGYLEQYGEQEFMRLTMRTTGFREVRIDKLDASGERMNLVVALNEK